MVRYAATKLPARVSLMRHFLPLPCSPATLPSRVTHRPAVCALIARAGSAQALAPANARTLRAAVNPTVIATLADAHLCAAALTVVEPVGRLVKRPQCCLPKHWTAPGKAGIKGLQNRHIGAVHRGPGVRRQSNVPGLRLFAYPTLSITDTA
jgi:hypothetical protein